MTLNLFDLFDNSQEYLTQAHKLLTGIKQTFDWFRDSLSEFYKDLVRVDLDLVASLPRQIKAAGEKWAEYGWVPFLPSFSIDEYLNSITVPASQEHADNKMMDFFETNTTDALFSEIRKYVGNMEGNMETLEEAIQCYEKNLFTSCSLCLFSLLDYTFIIGQSIEKGQRRALSKKAVERVYNKNETCGYLVNAIAVKIIIDNIFKDAKDFTLPEDGLNRNYVSHGMNSRSVTKTDCLKLFVLLYNVLLLFSAGIFCWEDKEDGC